MRQTAPSLPLLALALALTTPAAAGEAPAPPAPAVPATAAPAGPATSSPQPAVPPPPASQTLPSPAAQGAADTAPTPADRICRTLGEAAAANGLPVGFFTRLIWQESRFDPSARSAAGAQGIAQFMPGTAAWRGLTDPFEPVEALREAASYLSELRKTFGNLGIAAASYNAGPGRVARWLAGRAQLPGETRAYVRIVTGHSVDEWAAAQPPQWDGGDLPAGVPCAELAKLMVEAPPQRPQPNPAWAPWGVQLAGNWSEGKLLASFEQIRRRYPSIIGDHPPLVLHGRVPGLGFARGYMLRIPEESRAEADKLCARLIAAGGACAVLRNPREAS